MAGETWGPHERFSRQFREGQLDSRSGLIIGDFFSEQVGVNLKSNPASLLVYKHTVDEWLRRPGGCSQPKSSGRDVKSSGGPTHRTNDECLDWTTNQTRSKEHRKEKLSFSRRSELNAG